MIYTIYKSNGQITKVVDVIDIEKQVGADEYYIEGFFRDDKYYINNNIPIEIPDKPNEFCIFDFENKIWVEDALSARVFVRKKRSLLLSQSDWTQLPDVPLQTKQAWAEYRQALRDITDQPGYPFDIVWPQAPN